MGFQQKVVSPNKSVNSDVIARRSFVAPRNAAGYLNR